MRRLEPLNIKMPDTSDLKRNTATEDEIKRLHETIKNQNKKSWKDRYWYIIAIGTYIIGLFTPLIQKSIEQKISQVSNQSNTSLQQRSSSLKSAELKKK